MKTVLNSFRVRLAAVGLAGAALIAGAAFALAQASQTDAKAPDVNIPLQETMVPRQGLPRGSYAPIVEKVAPAVVKIVTTITLHQPEAQNFPGFSDPFWRQFFGNQFGQMFPSGPEVEHGLGSGVIVTKNGYILTNNHVVDHAKHVQVTLPDGRQFTGKVVGRDPKTDIAVVKIAAHDLPVVPMADSNKVKVGDVVLAIGNPFGVGETVTAGIVSALHRSDVHPRIEHYQDFIQTDAAINPGNSGGALVDIEGRLIGVNTAIMTSSGASAGVGFAIPSDLARSIMESLIKYGHVTRGYLGVEIQNVTPLLAQAFDLKNDNGALVAEVETNGPAHQAGFKYGDVIVKFNGQKVSNSSDLSLAVAATKPGSKVPVEIIRDGHEKTLEVTVQNLPGAHQLAEANSQKSNNGTLNGVTVGDLDPQARQQFHIPQNVQGALIEQVDPTSASAQAGLQPGQVIESINRHPVTNADEAVKLTEHPKSMKTLIRIWANGGSHYVVVDESGNGD